MKPGGGSNRRGRSRAGGAASAVPVAVILVGTVWGFFIHANLRWRFGPLEQLLATPAFHHWHHTNDTVNRDRNYASMLPVLDRLFGTLHLPRHWPEVYGVDKPVGGTMVQQIVRPMLPERPARQEGASAGACTELRPTPSSRSRTAVAAP